MTISSVQATKGVVESGQVRALAVTGTTRSPAMPDVPTMQEAGVPPPDVELRFWFAIFGPKGLPEAVKGKLDAGGRDGDGRCRGARAPRQARHQPDVVAGPALQVKLESEIRNWTRFIDAKGIKAE